MLYEIKSWLDSKVLFALECESLKVCVEAAVKEGANLYRADLYRANLYRANLYSANLSSANLSSANLYSANLSSANLYNANLYNADLSSEDLSSANLSSANLSWRSRSLLAEILRREACDDIAHRSFAGLVFISRDWCWDKWLCLEVTAEMRWAASVLAKWIKPDDRGAHIDAIKKLAADLLRDDFARGPTKSEVQE